MTLALSIAPDTAPAPQPTLPLSALVFDEAFNVRHNGATEDAELAASLAAEGVLVPFVVYPAASEGLYAVADGGRRLRLLQKRRDAGEIGDDYPVPFTLKNRPHAESEAKAVSLAVNRLRKPLHPVDEFEAYTELVDKGGATAAGIALRYGLSERQVKQRLALGRLAPEIREAWRKDELYSNQYSAEAIAAAFTVEPAHDEQLKTYLALKEKGRLDPHQIRKALQPSKPQETKKLLAFVGRDAYEATGETISEDLFGDEVYVSKFSKLTQLAETRIDQELLALRQAGWAHAHTVKEVGDNAHRLKEIEIDRARLDALETPEEKAQRAEAARLREVAEEANDAWLKAEGDEEAAAEAKWEAADDAATAAENAIDALDGELRRRALEADPELRGTSCVLLDIGEDGRLIVKAGLVKPKSIKDLTAKPEKKTPGATRSKAGSPEPKQKTPAEVAGEAHGLAVPVLELLSHDATRAVRSVVAERPNLALAIAIAACDAELGYDECGTSMGYDSHGGLPEDRKEKRAKLNFAERVKELVELETSELMKLFAHHVGRSIDLSYSVNRLYHDKKAVNWPQGDGGGLIDILPQAPFNAAIGKHFDIEAFLKKAGAPAALTVIRECLYPEPVGAIGSKPGKEIVAYAAALGKEKGWLPKFIRTRHYFGPGQNVPSEADKAKTAKKKQPAARTKKLQAAGIPTSADVREGDQLKSPPKPAAKAKQKFVSLKTENGDPFDIRAETAEKLGLNAGDTPSVEQMADIRETEVVQPRRGRKGAA